jgi:hypothetical protein
MVSLTLVWSLRMAPHTRCRWRPEITHHAEKAARIFETLRRQAAETEDDGRSRREDLRETAEDLRHQQLAANPVAGDARSIPTRLPRPISRFCASRAAPSLWRSSCGPGRELLRRHPIAEAVQPTPILAGRCADMRIPHRERALRRRFQTPGQALSGNPALAACACSDHRHRPVCGAQSPTCGMLSPTPASSEKLATSNPIGSSPVLCVVPTRPVTAVDRVRFASECLALVVAEAREAAHAHWSIDPKSRS